MIGTYNLYFDVAAIILTMFLITLIALRRGYKTKTGSIFFAILIINLISSSTDCIAGYFLNNPEKVDVSIQYIFNMLYMLSHSSMACVFLYYVFVSIKGYKINKYEKWIWKSGCIVDALLVLTTPLTKMLFYFNDEKEYCRGPLMYVLYAVSIGMVIYAFVLYVVYRKKSPRHQFYACIVSIIMMISAIVVQYFLSGILIENFICITAYLTIYNTFDAPEAFVYKNSGCYNKNAFVHTVESYIAKVGKVKCIIVGFENIEYMSKIWDMEVTDNVICDVAKYFHRSYEKMDVYYIGNYKFALFNTYNADIDIIRSYFLDNYRANNMDVSLIPEFASIYADDFTYIDAEDILHIARHAFDDCQTDDVKEIKIQEFISKKERDAAIIDIFNEDLKKEWLKVFYMPVYDVAKGSFASAEALVRIEDEKLGLITPSEFIPMAEKKGIMINLGEYILEKVCDFFDKERLDKKGIEHLEINLSAVQCMQENLSGELLSIIYDFDLEADMIHYDINESASGNNDILLQKNMKTLISKGSSFALDDFTMGIASNSFLARMPFSTVKISKEEFWKALKGQNEYDILEDTINMLKHLGKKIFIEGIEDEEAFEKVKALGADYIQGYYFTKPLDKKDFVEFLKQNNK